MSAAPAKPRKPLAGYLRLSEDRDGNKVGYDVQQKAIIAWAESQDRVMGKFYRDEDLTAADLDVVRPEYEQMLADTAAGQWGGIVVWRLDRLVRLTREFERCWAVVEDTKGLIASVTPAVNTLDPIGLMFIRLLVMLAENEINAMKTRQRAHQALKAEKGLYKGGGARPFGFVGAVRNAKNEIVNSGEIGIAHVPEEVELIREAARRILDDGDSYTDVVRDWCARQPPVTGPKGMLFSPASLYRVLTGDRVAGLRTHTVTDEDGSPVTSVYKAEWEPILDSETWERLRALRVVQKKRGRPYSYLLGERIFCACRWRMVGGGRTRYINGATTNVPGYRCVSTPDARAKGACGLVSVSAGPAEERVLCLLLVRLAAQPGLLDNLAEEPGPDPRVEEALGKIAHYDRHLAELEALVAVPECDGGLSPSKLPALRRPVLEKRAEAVGVVEESRRALRVPVPLGNERDDMRAWFVAQPLVRQRAFLKRFIRSVVIHPARGAGTFDPARVVVTFADAEELHSDGQ